MSDNDITTQEVCYLDEIIIEGMTTDGFKFRPSDWVDRLCGTLAGFKEHKFEYSPYLRPLVYQDMNCIALKKSLQDDIPLIFNFIMQFAADNQLVVIDCAKFKQYIERP